MEELNELEQAILQYEVDRVGRQTILNQIATAKPKVPIQDEGRFGFEYECCYTIKLKIDRDTNHLLFKRIIDEINKKENYIPDTIKKENCVTMPNNFLGNYTEYWHKEKYIKVVCSFFEKEVLERYLKTKKLKRSFNVNKATQRYICKQCNLKYKLGEMGECQSCLLTAAFYQLGDKQVCVMCFKHQFRDVYNVCMVCRDNIGPIYL